MKKSKSVKLTVLGFGALSVGALLSGCDIASSPPDMHSEMMNSEIRRNSYASKQECEKEWGSSTDDCQSNSSGSGYVGPNYFWSHSAGHPYVVQPDGKLRPIPGSSLAGNSPSSATSSEIIRPAPSHGSMTSRGGFGSTARSFSAGG